MKGGNSWKFIHTGFRVHSFSLTSLMNPFESAMNSVASPRFNI